MSDRAKLSLRFLLALGLIALAVAFVHLGSNGHGSMTVYGLAGGLVVATGTLFSLYSVVAVPPTK